MIGMYITVPTPKVMNFWQIEAISATTSVDKYLFCPTYVRILHQRVSVDVLCPQLKTLFLCSSENIILEFPMQKLWRIFILWPFQDYIIVRNSNLLGGVIAYQIVINRRA